MGSKGVSKFLVPYKPGDTAAGRPALPRVQLPAHACQHYRVAGLGAIAENDPSYFI